jgi:hypothetical protein
MATDIKMNVVWVCNLKDMKMNVIWVGNLKTKNAIFYL